MASSIDATEGRRTRSIIVTDSDHVDPVRHQPRDDRRCASGARPGWRARSVVSDRATPVRGGRAVGHGQDDRLSRASMKRDPTSCELSVSHTTRKIRPGERRGRRVATTTSSTPSEFNRAGRAVDGAFIESRGVQRATTTGRAGRRSRAAALDRGFAASLLEIEVQGARQIHERREDVVPDLPAATRSRRPELERRLRGRGTDDADDGLRAGWPIAEQRARAAAEIFDYAVVNDDLEDGRPRPCSRNRRGRAPGRTRRRAAALRARTRARALAGEDGPVRSSPLGAGRRFAAPVGPGPPRTRVLYCRRARFVRGNLRRSMLRFNDIADRMLE